MWIICLAFWMKIHFVMCDLETVDVVFKYFSTGEQVTLKCKCVAVFWNGPARNMMKIREEEISQVELTNSYGNSKVWNVSIYTTGENITTNLFPTVSKRLNMIGENFDLQITNFSSSDEGLYICDTSVGCPSRRYRYLLQTKCKPFIKVNVSDNFILEGETALLYCTTNSITNTTSMAWYKDNTQLISSLYESSLRIMMRNVSRLDTGNYTCFAQNEIGNASQDISLVISYPPVVNVRNRKLPEDSLLREMQCVAKGEPDTYTYFPWEHRSQFDEHIRYLEANDNGTLQLPEADISNSYENIGVYICNVSNGIPDYHGNVFQQGRMYVEYKGCPVFSAENLVLQYSTKESETKIKVKVYSSSHITCHTITEIGTMPFKREDINVTTSPIQIKERFFDEIITLNGTEIIFVLNHLNTGGSHEYNVTVCNIYGQSSFGVVLKPVGKTMISQRTTLPTIIIVTSVILTLLLVPLLLKCIFIFKNSIKNETMEEDTEIIEGQSESVANRLYHSIQESEMSVTQTQDDMTDEVTLTVPNTRRHNQHNNREAMDDQLNYADVIFQPSSSSSQVRIVGIEDRIHYADVDVSVQSAFLPDVNSVGDGSDIGSQKSSSEDDFVYVGEIENYIQNRPTNI